MLNKRISSAFAVSIFVKFENRQKCNGYEGIRTIKIQQLSHFFE